jgi:2-keto-4-pentenoate hydratase/2-oxohepta-3-ene-1,7-dioic acid hydratase in catechol pathway
MRIVRFKQNGNIRTGVQIDGAVKDAHLILPELADVALPGDIAALITSGMSVLKDGTEKLVAAEAVGGSEIQILAPINNPPKIICCWVNYLAEGATSPSEDPVFFGKYNSAIIGSGDKIRLPAITTKVVVEPELTAVIGKTGRHISVQDALSHVAGYTIVNDVTSFNHRLIDLIGSRGPNMMAKTFDTFAPVGPCIVTTDEIPEPHSLRVRQWLNGSLEIDSNTSEAVTKLPEFIAYLSSFFTLEPGDLILTGSPKPLGELKFLAPGDQVKIEIEGVGVLDNPVVAD